MDFDLNADQKLLRDTAKTFVKQKSPVTRFRELRGARKSWDPELWQHMGELGWLSVPFAEDHGGFGGNMVDAAILLEAFGTTLVPEPYIPSVCLAGMALANAASDAQREQWLAPMMEGNAVLALAHAERDNRFDLEPVETEAKKDGSGWRLRGSKRFVLAGQGASQIVVSATTPDGLGLFVVDPSATGVNVKPVRTMDSHGAAMIDLDVAVGDDARLGDPGDAARDSLDAALDFAAAATCAESLGVATTVLKMTQTHLKEREQFGKAIGTFQVLQHATVDMFVHVELIRSMSILAAVRATESDVAQRHESVSAAKAHVAQSGRFVTQTAIQLHGGIGITDEHDIGLYFKRMHTLGLMFGDAEHHVARFAASPSFAPS